MFAFTADADTLLTAFGSVDVLVDECLLRVSEDEVTATAIDPASVAMVDVSIEADAFESFEGETYLLGFPVTRFTDVVRNMKKSGETIRGKLNERTRELELETNGLMFNLSLIDPDSIREEPDMPELTLPTEVTMNGSVLHRVIDASNMVSDRVVFGSEKSDGEFYGYAKGDTDEVEITLTDSDYERGVIGDAHSLFSLDYLTDMKSSIPKDEMVTLHVGDEFPLIVKHGGDPSPVSVKYILAPRIQSD